VGAALEVTGVTKRFRRLGRPAVTVPNDLSLEVREGEIFGLLGPNGAGKTTTLQIVLGLLRPDAGRVRVLGATMDEADVRRRVGYVPDAPMFPKAMRALEALELHARLLGLSRRDARARARFGLERMGLSDAADRRVAALSRGMLQRLGLAQALLGDPVLLILDEPVGALDPGGVLEVRKTLEAAKAGGATIVISSHLLSEVERISDRVAFLREGRVVAVHEVASGRDAVGVRVRLARELTPEVRAALAEARVNGLALTFPVASEAEIPDVVRRLVAAGAEVVAVEPGVERPDLEALYFRYVEGRPS
jgi:ABC-2 type transport system ATP-binding protein